MFGTMFTVQVKCGRTFPRKRATTAFLLVGRGFSHDKRSDVFFFLSRVLPARGSHTGGEV